MDAVMMRLSRMLERTVNGLCFLGSVMCSSNEGLRRESAKNAR